MNHNRTSIVMTFEPLSPSQRSGAMAVSVVSLLSEFALVFTAFRTMQLAMMFLNPDDRPSRPPEILLFFRTQLGHYAACLILSNMFISTAGLINFGWVSHSGLSRGSVCSVQAVLMQIGIWSTSWFTAVHAVHTLISLVFRVRPAGWWIIVTILAGWIIAFISALAPLLKSSVYGPAGASCGIAPFHTMETFVLGALPIILGAFVSIAIYFVVLVTLSGKPKANNTRELRGPRSNNRRQDKFEDYHASIGTIVRTMLWFPLAYVFLLLPFCIRHIIMFAGHSVPPALSPFANACASMLGLISVGLLFNTIRVIHSVCSESAADAEKSFGNDASGESPVDLKPTSPPLPVYKSSHLTFIPAKRLSHHTLTTVNSPRELILGKKALYEFGKAKVASLVLNNIMPPAELSRQLEGPAGVKQGTQSEAFVNLPLYTTVPPPCPPHLAFVTGDATHEPCIQNEQPGSQMLVHTNTFGIKVPTKKYRAPPPLDVSSFPDVPSRINIEGRCPERGMESDASSSFRASTATDVTDCDPDDLREIVYAYTISSPHVQGFTQASAAARHMSRMTVWSQASASASGYATSHSSESDSIH